MLTVHQSPMSQGEGAAPLRVNHFTFDSLAALADYADKTPILNPTLSPWSLRNNDPEWYGRASFQDALHLARYGWKEGRDKMDSALQHAKAATTPRDVPALRYDVAGSEPDVGRFLSGDPLCMVDERPDAAKVKPVVRIIINGAASSVVPGENIMNRGAAILAQLDAWEQAGWECELSVESATRFHESEKPAHPQTIAGRGQVALVETMLKRAGEPLDIDAAAFAIVHPAMFRRLALKLHETLDDHMWSRHSHGSPCPRPAALLEGLKPCVYFPPMFGGQVQYDNAISAAAHVGKVFAEVIEASRDAA